MNEAKRSLSSLVLRSYNIICFKAISPCAMFALSHANVSVYSLIMSRCVCLYIASMAICVMPCASSAVALFHDQCNSGSASSVINAALPCAPTHEPFVMSA